MRSGFTDIMAIQYTTDWLMHLPNGHLLLPEISKVIATKSTNSIRRQRFNDAEGEIDSGC